MILVRPAALAVLCSLVSFPALSQEAENTTVTVRDTYGQLVTTLTLSDAGNGIVITGTLDGVDPGLHGFHLHEVGVCEPPFETAGGHFNPTGKKHGILNPDGHHLGDLPNIFMPKEGEGAIQIFATGVTLKAGEEGSLRDEDGTAIVIHSGPDDYKTDPSGDSGGRIACGVLR